VPGRNPGASWYLKTGVKKEEREKKYRQKRNGSGLTMLVHFDI